MNFIHSLEQFSMKEEEEKTLHKTECRIIIDSRFSWLELHV
jgi:hypothetical protein